jgi:TP901 family phage tail tape measure protein
MSQQYTRQVNIYVDSGQAQAAYDALEAKNNKLTASEERAKQKLNELQRKLETLSDKGAIDAVNKDIKAQEVNLEKLTKTQAANAEQLDRLARKLKGELSPSYKDLTATAAQLNRELKKMSEQDPGFDALKAKTLEANNALKSYKISMGSIKSGLKEFAAEAGKIATGVIIGNTVQAGIQWAVDSATNLVKSRKELARELTNIEKVTGLSTEETKKLNSEFRDMETSTPTKRLREMSVEAGKLGIEGAANIKKFVEQANMIEVALGEDLGQNAVADIQKLANIFNTEMKNIGSALNDIEQKSSASATYQVDFMSRMAGVSQTTNLAADSILGYGSTLEQMKQPIEASSTALNTFFIDFVKNTEAFGKSAGFAQGELSKLLSEKGTNEAFITFLEKLKEGSTSSADLLRKLQDMGIDGARGAATFLTLANNTKLVREQQALANDAITKGTSLTVEYNKVNNDLSSNLDKLSKKIAGWFAPIGNAFGAMLEKLLETKKTSGDLFNEQDSKVRNLTGSLNPLLDRYETLKNKTNRSKVEQAELNKTIQDISAIVPSAVTQFDKYGKALDINAQKVKGFMESEQRRLAIYNKAAIQDEDSKLKAIEARIQALLKRQTSTLNQRFAYQQGKYEFTDEMKNPILAKIAKELGDANAQADELRKNILALKGEPIPTAAKGNESSVLDAGSPEASEKQKAASEKRAREAKDKRDRELEAQKRFLQHLEELRLQHDAAMQNGDEEEIARIQIKYRRMRAEMEQAFPVLTETVRKYREELAKMEGEELFGAQSDIEYKAALRTAERFYQDKKQILANALINQEINEKEYHEAIKSLDHALLESRVSIAKDYVQTSKEAAKDITNYEQELSNSRIQMALNEAAEKKRIQERANEENISQLEHQQHSAKKTQSLKDDYDAEVALAKEKYQQLMDLAIQNGESTVEIENNFKETIDNIDEQYLDAKTKMILKWVQFASSTFTDALNIIHSIEANADARELARDKKKHQTKVAEYKKQLDNKLISQKQYDELVTKENEKMEAKEKEMKIREFNRNKAMQLNNAAISVASSVLATFFQFGGWPSGVAPAGIMAAIGATQIGIIASQEPPELEYGGELDGPSHAEGGMDVVDKRTGRVRYNIEGQELLLSKYFKRANPELIAPLLEASRRGVSLFEVMSAGTSAPRLDSRKVSAAIDATGTGTTPGAASGDSLGSTLNKMNLVLDKMDKTLEMLQEDGITIDHDKLARALIDANDASNLFI